MLTWEACVTEARTRNPDLREARYSLSASSARRNAAFGGFLPRVGASVSASDSGVPPRFRGVDPGYGAQITASQSLFSGFSTVADAMRACAAYRREKSRLRQTEADLRQRLRRAFVDVLYGQTNVKVQESMAARRLSNAELVRLRYEAGRENKGSAMRAQADAQQADFEAARAKRALVLARQKLARELGRDEFSPSFETEGDWSAPAPPGNPDLARLAMETPAVTQSQANEDEARAQYLSAAAPFWPSVDASASISRDGPAWPPPPSSESWSVGASISYNLFSGGRDFFSLLASRAAARSAKVALSSDIRDTRVALQETLFSYTDAHENVKIRQQYLEAARERAEIARAQYGNGLLGFVQWDIIEGELVESERSIIAARRDSLNAEAAWLRSLGTGFNP
jgi:outer membrane protein TolC